MAQTQLYMKKAQIFVKEEATVDTYIAQAAGSGDALLAETATYTVDSTNYQPSTVRGDFLTQDEVPGMASASIQFRVPCHGDGGGVAGVAPEFNEALKACGLEETVVGSTSVSYAPNFLFDGLLGKPGQSYSVTILEDGNSFRIKGAFGNVVFSGAVGEPMFLDFTFTGAYEAAVVDALETVTYDVGVSPSFLGGSFSHTIGGAVTPKGVQNFTLDTGNNVATQADVNDTAGIYGARIVERQSTLSIDPEMPLVDATNATYHTSWRAGTTGTFTTGTIGSAASNKYAITVNRFVLRPPELTDRDGIRTVSLTGAISSAAGDVEGTNDDFAILFT